MVVRRNKRGEAETRPPRLGRLHNHRVSRLCGVLAVSLGNLANRRLGPPPDRIGRDVRDHYGHLRRNSLPVAFYRMPDREQGRGVESDWEKRNIAMALEFAGRAIERATREMRALFPDVPIIRSA